jgi:hypothetical protein
MNWRRWEYGECGSTAESCEGDEAKARRGVECGICGEVGHADGMEYDEEGDFWFHPECRE